MIPPVLIEPCEGSDTLVAAFTSYGADDAPPGGHEWPSLLREIPVHAIHLLDRRQLAYAAGVPGFGDSMAAIAQRIVEQARMFGARRILTLGFSMGGLAALMIGRLAGAELAITFSALATTSLARFERHDDPRCRAKLREISDLGLECDITHADQICRFIDFYDPYARLERLQAEMLAPLDRGALIAVPGADHDIPSWLAERHLLAPLLSDYIFPQDGRRARLLAEVAQASRWRGDPVDAYAT